MITLLVLILLVLVLDTVILLIHIDEPEPKLHKAVLAEMASPENVAIIQKLAAKDKVKTLKPYVRWSEDTPAAEDKA